MREPKEDLSDLSPTDRMTIAFTGFLLAKLVHREDLKQYWNSDNPLTFPEHPFGLPIRPETNPAGKSVEIYRYGQKAYFLAFMAQMLLEGQKPLRLRVIETEAINEARYKHDAYHEIDFPWFVAIHDKSTDYSGGGGRDKCELDGLFLILAHIYGLEIETVVIPYDRAQQIRERILNASITAGRAASHESGLTKRMGGILAHQD